jgi:hypothetical protein
MRLLRSRRLSRLHERPAVLRERGDVRLRPHDGCAMRRLLGVRLRSALGERLHEPRVPLWLERRMHGHGRAALLRRRSVPRMPQRRRMRREPAVRRERRLCSRCFLYEQRRLHRRSAPGLRRSRRGRRRDRTLSRLRSRDGSGLRRASDVHGLLRLHGLSAKSFHENDFDVSGLPQHVDPDVVRITVYS